MDLPGWQRFLAIGSHLILYALMFALPLVGWSMLSAGGYSIVVFQSIHLPPILPHDVAVFAMLRNIHTLLAFLLFAVFLGHLAAARFHKLIRRDGVLKSIV